MPELGRRKRKENKGTARQCCCRQLYCIKQAGKNADGEVQNFAGGK